jgi:hypothetical protein
MTDTATLAEYQPKNAAQALYLPWLRAKIDSLGKPGSPNRPGGTPPRKHKVADRGARKALARSLGDQRHRHLESGGSYRDFQFQPPA